MVTNAIGPQPRDWIALNPTPRDRPNQVVLPGREEPAGNKTQVTPKNQGQKKNGLTPEEQDKVKQLQAIDQHVRAHEAAHMAAGGQYVRGVKFEYATGPDGKQYAVGGEVGIEISSGGSPETTIAKAQSVRRAALAPADPSPQDRSVAAAATQMELKAHQEMVAQGEETRKAEQEKSQAVAKKSQLSQTQAKENTPVQIGLAQPQDAKTGAATPAVSVNQASATLSPQSGTSPAGGVPVVSPPVTPAVTPKAVFQPPSDIHASGKMISVLA